MNKIKQLDSIYFIENYCLVNGQHIKLNNVQKNFINWLNKNEKKFQLLESKKR